MSGLNQNSVPPSILARGVLRQIGEESIADIGCWPCADGQSVVAPPENLVHRDEGPLSRGRGTSFRHQGEGLRVTHAAPPLPKDRTDLRAQKCQKSLSKVEESRVSWSVRPTIWKIFARPLVLLEIHSPFISKEKFKRNLPNSYSTNPLSDLLPVPDSLTAYPFPATNEICAAS